MTITIEQAALLVTALVTAYLGVKDLRNKRAKGDSDLSDAWQKLIAPMQARIVELEASDKRKDARIAELEVEIRGIKSIDEAIRNENKVLKAQKELLINSHTVHRIPLPDLGVETRI